MKTGSCESSAAIAILNHFSRGARCVAGHNIAAHDVPVLSEKMPSLDLLTLPVIDTLQLSPICFPENPYHRLIKDYKLVAASRNDPVADARASGHVLADEVGSLRGTLAAEPVVFSMLHGLLCSGPFAATPVGRGLQGVFREAGGGDPPDVTAVLIGVRSLLHRWACQTAAKMIGDGDLDTADARWKMAYTLTWLRVAGGASVLPPWVRHHHPGTGELLARLREVPCDHPGCAYCRAVHDPERQLATHFGFPAFRDTPADTAGRSLQREIVLAGMRQQSLLAILPTGGGKSICFQLPALIRNIRRGQLTIVISPLQALMKDQVDGLGRRGVHGNVAALNGLLTMPERADVLRRTYMGDLALLYVSPEQLRSRAFTHAVLQRDIGAWILDEAHCLSKWGHDFRPDYLYIGRCIRTIAQRQGASIPPIGCFTATAKRDVLEEILEYFRRETGTELALYEGGVERRNLHFEVRTIGRQGKLAHMDELLHEHLDPPGGGGSAIVFRATQRDAEITAAYLSAQGWTAAHFHAGLPPPDKKRIQDAFLDGTLRVICATNAFGMGVDKDDVRLVIHGDTPGSLENYLQEAGRAGRDRLDAHCVLLYDEEDCERQFRLGALSELSRRDILAILRGLRRLAKSRSSEVVEVTTGELLRDETVDVDFGAEDRSADTKVRAAIAWLERAGFVERNENETHVIQARVMVATLAEAEARMAKLGLSRQEAGFWLAILREMMNADPDDLISVDQLGQLPEFQKLLAAQTGRVVRERSSREYLTAKIFKVLGAMTGVGLLKKDTLLSAFVRHKIADHSALRLARIEVIDRALLALLSEEAPDPEGWVALDVRLVNQALVSREIDSSPEMVRRLLRSLSEDGRGFSGQAGSLELRYVAKDRCRVRLRRTWPQIAELAERRRRVARRILDHILQTIPAAAPARADHRTEFTYEALARALDADPVLRSEVRDVEAAIERALMFLHEMDVIILQRGLAIFRSAMTIRLLPDAQGQRYSPEHYEALRHHYQERIFQVHVMNEYAKRGLERMREALALVLAYFTMDKESFIARYFMQQREMLERATTAKSYRLIVDSLGNPDQQRIVTASRSRNLLVLAGPGSGKTRTVIHRCAYLLRVRRVRPEAILVCCFNHSAAVDLRRRLRALVGAEAGGVTVQTYHGLALRILGRSCSSLAAPASGDIDFDAMIREATAVLRGEHEVVGLAGDEVRDRILSGYEHILVDEYQDIDEPQYELIAAITGRREREEDRRLVIMAVGDDDQNVYTFRGANVAFIRRFKEDYAADTTHLVENYRSTRYIIDAANRVIALNRDRMKTGHPIRIDQGRGMLPAGGPFGDADSLTRGRVSVIEVTDMASQGQAMMAEIRRLRTLGVGRWDDLAVLTRHRRDLAVVRGLAERDGVPAQWPLDHHRLPPLYRMREIWRALQAVKAAPAAPVAASTWFRLLGLSAGEETNPWRSILVDVMRAWEEQAGDEPLPPVEFLDFVLESLAQRRRDERMGHGVVLSTVHGAKGAEYRHVLLGGGWGVRTSREEEEERRVFYVGMTRARESLTIFRRTDVRSPLMNGLDGPCFTHRRFGGVNRAVEGMARDYALLGLDDIFMDHLGRRSADDPGAAALRGLANGDILTAAAVDDRLVLKAPGGAIVGVLSESGSRTWLPRMHEIMSIRLLGAYTRQRSDVADPAYTARLRVDEWEVPLCELALAGKTARAHR